LHFKPDETLRSANRIEELLRDATSSAPPSGDEEE